MKDKVTSFETFVRLPWVSWAAPKAVRSDMAGPTLLGVAMASMTSGEASRRCSSRAATSRCPTAAPA